MNQHGPDHALGLIRLSNKERRRHCLPTTAITDQCSKVKPEAPLKVAAFAVEARHILGRIILEKNTRIPDLGKPIMRGDFDLAYGRA